MSSAKPRILIVEDEPRYVRAMEINLEARGFEVVTASDGRAAVALAASEEPHLIILDLRLPIMDGYEACRRIREFSTVPIIMLTALADERDKIKGLDAGADDYVTKPFSIEELLARVRAGLRRSDFSARPLPQPSLECGELRVNFAQKRVFVSGHEISLTPIEYRLLCELAHHPGQVLLPDYLLERVWGAGYEQDVGLLQQAVHRLRRKVSPTPDSPCYIETRRGIGYVFMPGDVTTG